MNQYNPNIHHRHSIRLRGYDYSQEGLYFVTICTQNRECLFGEIADGEMHLNKIGTMIDRWCKELSHKFQDIVLDTYIVMPNHFHAIIVNTGASVGADLRVCPDISDEHENILGEHGNVLGKHEHTLGEHTGSPLHAVIQWFKTMTTNEYIRGVKTLGWQPFNRRVWQRNYYEHIIRNHAGYVYIAGYITHNPANWDTDCFCNP
jgi:REP element-mobilizing transposase RayT